MPAQDDRLAAIAAAAAAVLRQTPYHVVRAGDVAAAVRLPGQAGRSAVWLYNEVHNRRVLVALAAAHAWQEFAGQVSWSPPGPIGSVTAARSAAVAALGVIVAFHRAEHPLMTQVGYGIGDISTAEKRKLATGTGVTAPSWPDSPWGRVAAAAWNGRCDVFTDFLRPVLRACAESVTHLAEPNITESASRLSDVTFRTCLADREGPVDLLARGLAALWFERDLTRLAGALPRDLESAETALAAVARRRTDPRAEANANAVVVRILLEAGTLHRRCVGEAQRTVALWQSLAADLDGPATSGAKGTTCSGSATPPAIWAWPRPGSGTGGRRPTRGSCPGGSPTRAWGTTSPGSPGPTPTWPRWPPRPGMASRPGPSWPTCTGPGWPCWTAGRRTRRRGGG